MSSQPKQIAIGYIIIIIIIIHIYPNPVVQLATAQPEHIGQNHIKIIKNNDNNNSCIILYDEELYSWIASSEEIFLHTGAASGDDLQLQSSFLTGIVQTDPALMLGPLRGVGNVGRIVSFLSSSSGRTMTTTTQKNTLTL